jgi:site-specific DNA-methyltransferase (adenine-specific)
MEYFKTEKGILYCEDALEKLKELEDESVDLLLTDPPYGVIGINEGYSQEWDTFSSEEEFWDFTKKWLKLAIDKMKYGASAYVFWSQKRMFDFYNLLKEFKQITFKRMLIWHHPNLAKPTRKMYLWTYDPIFFFVKGKKERYFDSNFTQGENTDVFKFMKPQNNYKNEKRLHPAQKPLDLIKILIKNSTKEGWMVLDPFLGSGTTAVASEQLNRRWIGIEKEKRYCEIIKERLRNIKHNRYIRFW